MKHFAIIYDSKTGTTKQAAAWIAEGIQAAGDVDAKCFSIPDVDLAFTAALMAFALTSALMRRRSSSE